ncbi:MAG: glycosyltransferase family 2 protein [Methanomicrobia archaeon]|nr:glycosyltransferase family 2 protein [Methanomicrobia archaeon]
MQEAGEEKKELSVVLPAHNEASKLEAAVRQTKQALAAITAAYEILIAEDGSTDGTADLASRIAAEDSSVRHIHSDERLGRGKALNRAFKSAHGDILMYMDVDLSTDLSYVKPLINAIRAERYDFAIGSRLMKESDVKRSFKRSIMSKAFNFLVRVILRSTLRDHQCGFKSFRKEALMQILDEIEDEHWFWDTELLVRAQRSGYRVKELPVIWTDKGAAGTKVNAFNDSTSMFSKIIKLHFHLRVRSGK